MVARRDCKIARLSASNMGNKYYRTTYAAKSGVIVSFMGSKIDFCFIFVNKLCFGSGHDFTDLRCVAGSFLGVYSGDEQAAVDYLSVPLEGSGSIL